MENVHPNTKRIWIFEKVKDLLILIGPLVLGLVFREFDLIIKLMVIIATVIIFRVLWDTIMIPLDYKFHRYLFNEQKIEYTSGGFDRHHFYIPISCIQHVDIQQGTVCRFFKLYAIHIHTAGDTHKIGYIPKEKAEYMKDFITNLLQNGGGKRDGD